VTSTFAAHVASGRGPGIDFGNTQCGANVLAMAAGTVSLAGYLGTAKVVRVRHSATTESGYAHLATITVKVGQIVKRGQKLGTVGKTGATACHLHGGFKVSGVERDFWPLLDQNQKYVTVNAGVNIRKGPGTSYAALGAGPVKVLFDRTVTGGLYTLGGVSSRQWDKITYKSAVAYAASLGTS